MKVQIHRWGKPTGEVHKADPYDEYMSVTECVLYLEYSCAPEVRGKPVTCKRCLKALENRRK